MRLMTSQMKSVWVKVKKKKKRFQVPSTERPILRGREDEKEPILETEGRPPEEEESEQSAVSLKPREESVLRRRDCLATQTATDRWSPMRSDKDHWV